MKQSTQIAFLFIGTVIGAGFATGREISLFFGDASPLVCGAAGVFLGLICTLLLLVPKAKPSSRTEGTVDMALHAAVSFCSLATSASMTAATEELFFQLTGIRGTGALFLVLASAFAFFGLKQIKVLNCLVIPLLAVFVVFLYVKGGVSSVDGKMSLFKPIAYGGLNSFLAGILLLRSDVSKKQAVGAGAMVGAVLFCLLFAIQVLIRDYRAESMPLFRLTVEYGYPLLGGAIIAIAIFTTLLSSSQLLTDEVLWISKFLKPFEATKKHRAVAVLLVSVLSFALSYVGFAPLVNATYPVISACGIALLAFAMFRLPKNRAFKRKD